jgi:hypothetical protein
MQRAERFIGAEARNLRHYEGLGLNGFVRQALYIARPSTRRAAIISFRRRGTFSSGAQWPER